MAGLIADGSGNLYGTTIRPKGGGVNSRPGIGRGRFFKTAHDCKYLILRREKMERAARIELATSSLGSRTTRLAKILATTRSILDFVEGHILYLLPAIAARYREFPARNG